jgi:hypothetical protein
MFSVARRRASTDLVLVLGAVGAVRVEFCIPKIYHKNRGLQGVFPFKVFQSPIISNITPVK